MKDLSSRMANRVQLSTDGLAAYADAVERAFGAEVDYDQAVKFYEAEPIGPGRYSPPRVVDMKRSVIAGNPDESHISTSYIERQNHALSQEFAGHDISADSQEAMRPVRITASMAIGALLSRAR